MYQYFKHFPLRDPNPFFLGGYPISPLVLTLQTCNAPPPPMVYCQFCAMCRSPNKGVVVQIYQNVPTVFINSYQLPGKFNIQANFIMSSCLCLVHFWLFVCVRSARRYTLLDATRLDHVHCGWTFSLLKADENKEIILLVQFYYKNSIFLCTLFE